MKQSKIEVSKLSKIFQHGATRTIVLDGITQSFAQGKTYAIIGASGVGKSTLMHLLAGLDQPTDGLVLYDDHDINAFKPASKDQFLNTQLGLLFQDSYLINELSVLENVIMKGIIAKRPKKECIQEGRELLSAMGLQEKIDAPPATLSGGQQQRASLARALFGNPAFILADEPTGNLDVGTAKKIVDLLLETARKNGSGLILSTHDPYVYEKMETVFELRDGKLYVH